MDVLCGDEQIGMHERCALFEGKREKKRQRKEEEERVSLSLCIEFEFRDQQNSWCEERERGERRGEERESKLFQSGNRGRAELGERSLKVRAGSCVCERERIEKDLDGIDRRRFFHASRERESEGGAKIGNGERLRQIWLGRDSSSLLLPSQ